MPDKKFHPLANIFPLMDEAGLAELAADIKAESQREPIVLWQEQIIDGPNRYRACQIAEVEPVIKTIDFPGGEAEALNYVVSRNLKRRGLRTFRPVGRGWREEHGGGAGKEAKNSRFTASHPTRVGVQFGSALDSKSVCASLCFRL